MAREVKLILSGITVTGECVAQKSFLCQAYAASWRAATRRNQLDSWFQLVKIWLTTFLRKSDDLGASRQRSFACNAQLIPF